MAPRYWRMLWITENLFLHTLESCPIIFSMNIQARLKQAEERAMLLQKKADTIHLIMVKPVPGKERFYTILGEDGIYNEKKLAEFQQKHSVVTTIILNIPRLPEEGVLNAEKK